MTAATIKKIKTVKPPYPFEAYAHVISKLPKEDGGGFLITFPDLPGCMSDGATEAEAVANGKYAFKAWVSARKDAKKEIPEPFYRPDTCRKCPANSLRDYPSRFTQNWLSELRQKV